MSPTIVRLSDIFRGIEIPEELNENYILKTDADSNSRTMDITLSTNKIIPYGIIEDFKRLVAQKFNLSKLVIRVKYNDIDFEKFNYELYYQNLVFYVNELVPGVRHVFTDSTAKFADGKYTINLKYGTELIENEKCHSLMERIVLSQLGCNMEFEFVDDRNEEAINKLKEEALEKLEKIVVPPPVEDAKSNEELQSEIIFGKPIKEDCVGIDTIVNEETGFVIVKGEVLNSEFRELKNKKILLTFFIADNKSAFSAKCFLTDKQYKSVKGRIKDGVCVKIKGRIQYDTFKKENTIMINDISEDSMPSRKDNAPEKRVELHMHTKMSQMDAMTDAKTLVKQAIKWGHKAIAITDHGNVQAFPEAMHAAEKSDLKVIYGMECYLIDDMPSIVRGRTNKNINSEFVVFDVETTGFSAENDSIIEIGAVKVKDMKITDSFSAFVNPGRHIPERIVELTGIDDDMVKDAPSIDTVIKEFCEFIGDADLVAHNAKFDTSFIRNAMSRNGLNYSYSSIDTVELARALSLDVKNYKLNTLAAYFKINLENHHRACDDARATGEILIKLFEMLKEKNIEEISSVNSSLAGCADYKSLKYFHCII